MYSALILEPSAPKAGTPGDLGSNAGQAAGAVGNGTTAVVAQGPGTGASQGSGQSPFGMVTMLLPLLILVPFFFMQSRRQKKDAEARSKLKKGDRVVSTSGLIGELVEIDERVAKVKLGPGLTVQMLASTVQSYDANAVAGGASGTAAPASAPADAKPSEAKK